MEKNDFRVPRYIWAKEVKRIDGYRCAVCGSAYKVQAHHIKPRAEYPELSDCVNNGITLCLPCHWKVHDKVGLIVDYDSRCTKTRAEILEYIENSIVVFVPRGRKRDIEAHAQRVEKSVNGLVSDLLRGELKMSPEQWKAGVDSDPAD